LDEASLAFRLESEGVVTECEITTLEVSRATDFTFRAFKLIGRAVLKSQYLRDCFAELEAPGATEFSIHMLPRAPFLSIQLQGDSTSCKVDFPTEMSVDVFSEFECTQEARFSYPISHLTLSQKALDKAQQTALRLNEEGMLSMQHVIPAGEEGVSNWVEFLFLPKA